MGDQTPAIELDKEARMTAEQGEKPPEPRVVDLVHPSYQPSKAELEEDLRVDATFEEAVQALARPVKVQYVRRPKRSG